MAVPPEIGHACALGQVDVVEAWLDSDSAHHGHHPHDISLNCLRVLCERDRATAPSGVLATLMGPKLPRELFVYVLSFWRSARALDDRAFDRVRGRYLPTRYDYWYSYEAPDEVIMG